MKKLSENKLWADALVELKEYNSNFHWDKLTWVTRVWFVILFKVVENRLDKLENELKERVIL